MGLSTEISLPLSTTVFLVVVGKWVHFFSLRNCKKATFQSSPFFHNLDIFKTQEHTNKTHKKYHSSLFFLKTWAFASVGWDHHFIFHDSSFHPVVWWPAHCICLMKAYALISEHWTQLGICLCGQACVNTEEHKTGHQQIVGFPLCLCFKSEVTDLCNDGDL